MKTMKMFQVKFYSICGQSNGLFNLLPHELICDTDSFNIFPADKDNTHVMYSVVDFFG